MYRIVKKEKLANDVVRFDVKAPLVSRRAKAGQFVIIRVSEKGERIPLTISDYNTSEGIISLVAMRVGKTTALLSTLNEGDEIIDLVGPLGKESEIGKFGRVVCVGGGVGIAPVMPIAKELKKKENYIISILGARDKDHLILVPEMEKISDELYLCSDDGSIGFHGFVSDFLKELLEEKVLEGREKSNFASSGTKNENINNINNGNINRVIAIGPAPMMYAVSKVTRPYGIKTIVSLNSIMVDGTGMCGTCRVEVGGKTRFVCVDGPEFDGHEVDFDLLLARQKAYHQEERLSMELYEEKCRCGQEKALW